MSASPLLGGLVEPARLRGPALVVAAHPDDETIGAAAQLARLPQLILVHVTDGAPRDLADARRAGFADAAGYAAARRTELEAALTIAGVRPLHMIALGIADQQAWRHMTDIARRLAALIARTMPAIIVTHAYEGGHPDHDSTAAAVHAAQRLSGTSPLLVEMASYHRRGGSFTAGRFLPRAGSPSFVARLTPAERALRLAMLDCFVTQRATLHPFRTGEERFRRAPAYDFARPPHQGVLHYEHFDWGTTGEAWRAEARRVLCRLFDGEA